MTTRANDKLAPPDRLILEMIARGARNKEIADHLHYSVQWVKRRVGQLMRDFAVSNRVELALKARELDLVSPETRESYLVTHTGPLPTAVVIAYGASFQVSAGRRAVNVTVRIAPELVVSAGLHCDSGHASSIILALVRRLRSFLQGGIGLSGPDREVTIDSEDELKGLLHPPECDFKDAGTSHCRAASGLDPRRGSIDPNLCSCDLPHPEVRCQHLSRIEVMGVVSPSDSIHMLERRYVSSAACRAEQPRSIDCVDDCVPGRRNCWSIMAVSTSPAVRESSRP